MLPKPNLAGRPYLMIALAATLAAVPIAFRGNPWGHDVNLHLRSWMDAAQQFHEGSIFPRWAAGANMGFGEPFFIFYPPFSRLIGTSLGLVLPWKMVSGTYIWLMFLLAGVAMWKCASEWLAPADALMASVLFAINPYLLIIAYKRGNYADLLACALFPMLLWGGIKMGSAPARTTLPLSAVFAAIWLSDLPAAVVASYVLAMLLVFNAIACRSLKPLLFGALGILSAFGSIAFFLFPAASERRWVTIAEAVRSEWDPEHNFLFTHNNLPQYVAFNRGLSFIAVFLVIVTAGAAVLAYRLRQEDPRVWRALAVVGGISTFMMFPPSLVLYKTLPEMRYVEFPWRWLSPLCVVGAFLVASALSQVHRTWISSAAVTLIVASVGGVIIYTTNWDSSHYLEGLIADAHSTTGYPIRFGDWSNPLGSQPSKLDKTAPLIAFADPAGEKLVAQSPQTQVEQWLGQHKVFSVSSSGPLLLKLRLLTYPAWQAKLNGNIVLLQADPDTGQMMLPLPVGGLNRVDIQFGRTWDRTVGIAVSLVTILTCVPLMLRLRKQDVLVERRRVEQA